MMAKIPRIAVVGSANIDLTTFTDRFPKPGETIFGQKFDLGFGGKGANQAVAAKLWNRIFVVKGANDELKPADIDAAADLLKAVDCIVLQFEIPVETVYHTIAFARKNSIRCILNPAPAQPIDFKFVEGLDYFVPNESEAETITGMPVKDLDDAKKCAEKLVGYGIKRVIITLGANGSLLAGREGMEHVPAFPVKSIDSTGAGDAFIGSFAVFLGEGLPEQEAVKRANLYAGLSTTAIGTQKSFYDRSRFDAEWARRSKS
jgi:ribokinase